MMRTITIGIVLLALSAHGGSALTSAASNDALDAGLADERHGLAEVHEQRLQVALDPP